MEEHRPKYHWYISTLIAALGLLISFLAFTSANDRQLKLTEYSIHNIHTIDWTSEHDFNPYTEAFIHCFSNSYVQFHLENHTDKNIEFYGFYLQIHFPNYSHERINIPLVASTKDQEFQIDVFYSDWDAAAYIEKQVIPSNSTIEFTSSLRNSCFDLSHLWFLNSGLTELDHPISKVLEKSCKNNDLPNIKCRIACKDTFGEFHYSNWISIKFD